LIRTYERSAGREKLPVVERKADRTGEPRHEVRLWSGLAFNVSTERKCYSEALAEPRSVFPGPLVCRSHALATHTMRHHDGLEFFFLLGREGGFDLVARD